MDDLFFCDNYFCGQHVKFSYYFTRPVEVGKETFSFKKGSPKMTGRNEFTDVSGKKLFFCDTCAGMIKTTKSNLKNPTP